MPTVRSTTSSAYPSPPFYARHQTGVHRNALRAQLVETPVNSQVTDAVTQASVLLPTHTKALKLHFSL